MRIHLPLRYPYSFAQTTKRLKSFEKSSYVYRKGAFWRTIQGKKGPLLLSVAEDPNRPALIAEITGEIAPEEEEDLKKRVAHMFGVDVDLTPFYEEMKQDAVLWPVIEKRIGMHLVLDASLYECLIKTIIGQQLNVSFAATLIERFIQLAGETGEFAGEKWKVFPTAEQVARLSYEDLRRLQFNQRKAEYIIDLSRFIVEGRLDLEELTTIPDDEVMKKLMALRGIGRWTAECMLMFGLRRPDLLPAADIGLRNAIGRLYGLPVRPDENEVRRIGEKWAPFRSYVTFYLWDTLDEQKQKMTNSG
jgi:DNA-3-methyladenine glycosylase II